MGASIGYHCCLVPNPHQSPTLHSCSRITHPHPFLLGCVLTRPFSELFRTGPRPRRKGQASTTASSANSLQTLHHQQQQQLRRQQQMDGKSGGGPGDSMEEINESTTLVDCVGPNCPGNGTVSKGDNLYKQINNGRGRGRGYGGGYTGQDDGSRDLMQYAGGSTTGDLRGLGEGVDETSRDRGLPVTYVVVSTNSAPYASSSSATPVPSSSSHHRYPQPSPDLQIYNNIPSARQVPVNSSIPPAPSSSSSTPRPAEFDPEDIPEVDDPSSPTASSTSPNTVITNTNTTNSATTPSTPGYSNINTGRVPATGSTSSVSGGSRKNIYPSGSSNSRANGPSQVSTFSRGEPESCSVLLRPHQLLPNHPHSNPSKQLHIHQQQHQQPNQRPNLKRNRRYRRIHRLLPTRMMECLVREPEQDIDSDEEEEGINGVDERRVGNGSSTRMATSPITNTRGSKHGSQDFPDMGKTQSMRLTPVRGIDEGEYIEDFRQAPGAYFRPSPSPSSSYGNSLLLHEHACMLPPPPPPAPLSPSSPHDLRPDNLHLESRPSRDRLSMSSRRSPEPSSRRAGGGADVSSIPRRSPAYVQPPRVPAMPTSLSSQNDSSSLWPPDHNRQGRQIPGNSSRGLAIPKKSGGTPSCASSDSVAMSTLTDQMVMGFQHLDNSVGTDGCSQCSLQLGDTAETMRHDDQRLSSDRDTSAERDTDSLPTVPEKPDSGSGIQRASQNQPYPDPEVVGRNGTHRDSLTPPPPPPPPPLDTTDSDTEPSSSSFLLSSCSPDLQKLLRPALTNSKLGNSFVEEDPKLYKQPRFDHADQQHRASSRDRIDGRSGQDYSTPLHVDISNPAHRSNQPYPASEGRFQAPHLISNPRASQSTQSFNSDGNVYTPNRIRRKSNPSPVSASTSPSRRANNGPTASQSRRGRGNWSEAESSPVPGSTTLPPRSSASLPESMRHPGNRREGALSISPRQISFLPTLTNPPNKNMRGTSEDSGRSTLPHSPNASPRGVQQQARPSALYDMSTHGGFPDATRGGDRGRDRSSSRGGRGDGSGRSPGPSKFSPLLVAQTSTESGHDSPTSMCDECQREKGLLPRDRDRYSPASASSTPLTPGSRSQISNMSGVETSV